MTLFISSSVSVGVRSGTPKRRSARVVRRTQRVAIGESTFMMNVSGTATAREIAAGEAAPIAFGVISAKTNRVTVEKAIASGTPYFSPIQLVASAVARAEAELMNRFWPIRMVARSRGVCAFKSRMSLPLGSPLSRMRWRSMRPSDTRAVSAPAKNAERASERSRSAVKSRD
jgi:hypothetical protein